MTTQEDAPRTAAGKRLLDGFAPLPLPEAQELHRRSAMGRRVKVAAGILAIEQEAAQRALADVRWAVDVERLARAIIADGRLSHYLGDDWNAIVEAIAADYERLALLDTPPEGAETP